MSTTNRKRGHGRRRRRRLRKKPLIILSLMALAVLILLITLIGGLIKLFTRSGKSDKQTPKQNDIVAESLMGDEEGTANETVSSDLEADGEPSEDDAEPSELDSEPSETESSGAETTAATEESTEEVVEETIPDDPNNINLLMVGDVMVHDTVLQTITKEDGSIDYSHLFEHVKPMVQEADLSIVAAEMIIGGKELGLEGFPNFNADYSMADTFVDTGFDVVLHANNHAFDMKADGIRNCLTNWRKAYPNIGVLGIHDDPEDVGKLYITEVKGVKIAILNYAEFMNKKDYKKSKKTSYMIDMLSDENKIRKQIQQAKENADFVIVCPHWGKEYEPQITSRQKKWAKLFAEEDVDLVIGSHPHVCQTIETITNKETGHETVVYYSIGNFSTNLTRKSGYALQRLVGGMAQVTIGKKADGTLGILKYGVHPLICHFPKDQDDYTVYPMKDYTKEICEQHFAFVFNKKFSYDKIISLCNSLWDKKWTKK